MGDHDRGAAGEQAAHGSFDPRLGVQVDVGGGLVEDQDPRVGDQRAREREQLALAGRQLGAALADLGVIAARQLGDELVGADRGGGGADLRVVGVGAPEGDVLANRAREQERLLGHDPHLRAQRVAGDLAQVVSVDQHAPARRVVEAGGELGHRRLARRRCSPPARPSARRGCSGRCARARAPRGRGRRRRRRRPRARSGRSVARREGDTRTTRPRSRTSPRIGPRAGASGRSWSVGSTSSSSKIFSSAAIPDW